MEYSDMVLKKASTLPQFWGKVQGADVLNRLRNNIRRIANYRKKSHSDKNSHKHRYCDGISKNGLKECLGVMILNKT